MTAGVIVGLLALGASVPWWWVDRSALRRTALLTARERRSPHPKPAAARGGAGGGVLEVPVLVELLAAAVRAGAGVPRALSATGSAVGGEDGSALVRAAEALRLGAEWDAAWRDAPARLDVVKRSLRGAWVDGAAPTEALRAAGAEHAHERRAAARSAAARLAVRLVLPLGACFLPAFVLVGLVPVLLALGVDLLST
jgi:pilus assembly protein TadC